jgi:hypothetical protein
MQNRFPVVSVAERAHRRDRRLSLRESVADLLLLSRSERQQRAFRNGNFVQLRSVVLAAVGLAVAIGCGHHGPRRVPIEGTVTLDAKPLAEGEIRFRSLSADTTVIVPAKIADGRFTVPEAGGPMPGKYRVEIEVAQKTGRKVPHPMLPERLIDEMTESLPTKYNYQSTLTAEVTAAGPNRFEFPLRLK